MKLLAFTLDLESEYAGCVNEHGIFKDTARIAELLKVITYLGVKITVFVVGKILEQYPEVIRIFEQFNCEFEAHSYSHDINVQETEQEIEKAKSAYFNYFKKYPQGYRAARGLISPFTIQLLEKHGYLYDSSVFPSYFPNPLKYLFSKRHIHYYNNSKILEIPLTSITPLRLTLSISYIKLLGLNVYKMLFRLIRLPDVICFDSHLHDFIIIKDSYCKLSWFWKFIYGRNSSSGIDYLVGFLKEANQRGYRFCYMSEVYAKYR